MVFPPAKELDHKKFQNHAYYQAGLGYIVNYKNGKPHGNAWLGTVTNANLYGALDEEGRFTGAYIQH